MLAGCSEVGDALAAAIYRRASVDFIHWNRVWPGWLGAAGASFTDTGIGELSAWFYCVAEQDLEARQASDLADGSFDFAGGRAGATYVLERQATDGSLAPVATNSVQSAPTRFHDPTSSAAPRPSHRVRAVDLNSS